MNFFFVSYFISSSTMFPRLLKFNLVILCSFAALVLVYGLLGKHHHYGESRRRFAEFKLKNIAKNKNEHVESNGTCVRTSTRNMTLAEWESLKSVQSNSTILVFTVAVGDMWYKPLVSANRESYCKQHGYHNRFLERLTTPVEPGLSINWSKVTEGLRLFNRKAPYEWIFVTDLDLFVMNVNQTVEGVIDEAIQDQEGQVELIVARDGTGVNFASFMIRNSEYGKSMFQKLWELRSNPSVPTIIDRGHDSACLSHLMRTDAEFASRVVVTSQRLLNAYPHRETRSRNHNTYTVSDFVLHFVGWQKKFMAQFIPQPQLKLSYFLLFFAVV
jgi:hypothetical protein